MKDREARKMIADIKGISGGEQQLLNDLNGVSIKDCPKCKHPVLAIRREGGLIEGSEHQRYGCTSYNYEPSYYQCLTCGSKFTCSEKCVCELME